MNPEPLVGILANDRLELRLQRLRVALRVAGHGDGRIEAEDVAALPGGPESEAGDDGGAAARGEFREARAGARGGPEEIDKDPGIGRGILIDQNTDRLVGAERFEDRAGVI